MIYALAAYAPRWASRGGLALGLFGAALAALRYFSTRGQRHAHPDGRRHGHRRRRRLGAGRPPPCPAAADRLPGGAGAAAGARARPGDAAGGDRRAGADRPRAARRRRALPVGGHRAGRRRAVRREGRPGGGDRRAGGDRRHRPAGADRHARRCSACCATAAARSTRRSRTSPRSPGWSRTSGPAGSTSTCSSRASPQPLPAGPQLAAYRIVQESLTNVLKHAGPACRAWVRLQWRPDALELSVARRRPGRVGRDGRLRRRRAGPARHAGAGRRCTAGGWTPDRGAGGGLRRARRAALRSDER